MRRASASPTSATRRSGRGTISPSPTRIDTIFIDHVPVLDQTRRNPAKRFILLIDTLYDRHTRLVFSAEAPPQELYAGRPGVTEAFEFDRTVSRLIEMQSREWLDGWAERHGKSTAAAAS